MPKKTYVVETDKGSYEIDVEEPRLVDPNPGKEFALSAKEGLQGFIQGLLPGVASGAMSIATLPVAVLKEMYGTATGTSNLAKDPVGTLTAAAEAVKNVPGKAYDMLMQYADLARTDPTAFGKTVGELTGSTEAGIVAAEAVPLAPRPIARKAGELMETIGTKGQWPIRMMGAHQLGSGNPMGVATMMMPEALQAGSKPLIRFGGGLPVEQRVLNEKFADAMTNRNISAYDERAAADVAAKKVEANATRLADIEAQSKGLTPSQPAITRSTSATDAGGNSVRSSVRMQPPAETLNPIQQLMKDNPGLSERNARLALGLDAGPAAPVSPMQPTTTPPIRPQGANPVPHTSMEDLLNRPPVGRSPIITPQTEPPPVAPPITPMGKAASDLAEGRTPPAATAPPLPDARMDELLRTRFGGGPDRRTTTGVSPTGVDRRAPVVVPEPVAPPAGSVRVTVPGERSVDDLLAGMKKSTSKRVSPIRNWSESDIHNLSDSMKTHPERTPDQHEAEVLRLRATAHTTHYTNAKNDRAVTDALNEEKD